MFSVEVPRLRRKKNSRELSAMSFTISTFLFGFVTVKMQSWLYVYTLAWGVETLVHTCTVLKGYKTSPPR